MNYKDYRFDQSSYERPDCKHRCGRNRLWQRACWQGPSTKGKCGGRYECKPARSGDRYLCTRPVQAGGLCKSGPLPNGDCCQQHPPCVPSRSLRSLRGRSSLFILLFIIALIATFSGFSVLSESDGRPYSSMSDAGSLSNSHAPFNSDKSCGTCHQSHKKTGVNWLLSAFKDQDLTEGCLSCHRFEGNARSAHQEQFIENKNKIPEMECTSCHTEHKGENANIVEAALNSCSNCHKQKITNLKTSHPAFGKKYPYESPQSIYFDHKRHIGEYFVEDEWTKKPNRDAKFAAQAASACTSCHEVAGATRAVEPKSYDAMCSGCHQQQISSRPLITMTGDEAAPVLMALAAATENEFSDDSEDLALGTIQQMKDESIMPLMKLTGDDSAELWAGLSAVEVKMAAKAWAEEEDMESPMPEMMETAGWHAGENDDGDQSLFYRAVTHGDSVIKAWIENFVRRLKNSSDDSLRESMDDALDSLLNAKTGAGACGKCHASGIRNALLEESSGDVLWGYQTKGNKLHTFYSHVPHINLTGEKEGCDSCHTFEKNVDFAKYFKNEGRNPEEFNAAFSPINKALCVECHKPRQTSDSCLTCHKYHGKSDFRIGFMPKHDVPNQHQNEIPTPTTEVMQ